MPARLRSLFRPVLLTAAVALLAGVVSGCGSDDGGGSDSTASKPLVVSAASSLQDALTTYGDEFGDVRLSFAGSDELAAQIRQGVKPDVFASANTSLPEALNEEGLVGKPVVFAGNRLVLAVPADSDEIASLEDAGQAGVKLAIGSATVPIGSYTREVLDRLPGSERDAILGNVRSEEPDVKGIVGKLTQGAVDGGFVYVTDVAATKGALKAIELPADLQPSVAYGVAVVEGAKNPEGAKEFIDGLLSGAGRQALDDAGFEPPPQ